MHTKMYISLCVRGFLYGFGWVCLLLCAAAYDIVNAILHCMYVCLYVCVYIHVPTRLPTYTHCMHMYMHTLTHTAYTCMYTHVHMCRPTYHMHPRMYAYMPCMCVCVPLLCLAPLYHTVRVCVRVRV